jgi:hypothetical protein
MKTPDTLETISQRDLHDITGGVEPGEGGGGDALRKLASTEAGRKLLLEFLPPKQGPTPL